jgi:hypothetical protein
VEYEGPGQSFIRIFENFHMRSRFAGRDFDMNAHWVEAGLRPIAALGLALTATGGGTVDVVNTRAARDLTLSPSIDLRPGRHLDLRVRGALQWLVADGRETLRDGVVETRATAFFTPRAYLRATVQYRETRYAAGMNPPELAGLHRDGSMQLLAAYEPDPRTVVYIGYEDGRDAEPGVRSLLPRTRTFFLKVGYAIQP